jgi:hypothetical protein
MVKRRLPVVNSGMSDEPPAEPGGLAAWAGVAFFCAVLLWLPAAWLAGALTAAIGPRLGASHDVLTASALALAVLTQLLACFGSVAGAAFVVARFGPAKEGDRAAHFGVAVLVAGAVALVAVQEPRLGMVAAPVLLPVAFGGVRLGLRVGRHKAPKGI